MTKRSRTQPMSRPPDPRKRAKLESNAEELAKRIIVENGELRKALLKVPELRNSEFDMWTRTIADRTAKFHLGQTIRGPPAISNPYYADRAEDIYSLVMQHDQLRAEAAKIRPPPWEFSAAWQSEQEKYSDILCKRPPERTGLPLATLHAAFHRFQHEVNATFQESPETNDAARAADHLSCVMGRGFKDEKERTKAFNECMDPLFPLKGWTTEFTVEPTSETCKGIIDASFHLNDSAMVIFLREDKKEWGQAGDAYMQLARGYHMYVETLEDRKDIDPAAERVLAHGVPIFLLCVQGTTVSVSGGFYDGKAVTVEPLCASPWMLPGCRLQRELTQVLYALRRGVDNIQRSLSSVSTPIIPIQPSVPLLYDTCRKSGNSDVALPITILSVFHASWNKRIFNAKLDGDRDVLAKMTHRAYGDGVHKFLALKGFAPDFLGTCDLDHDGGPTMYVMEKLDGSWVTLSDWGGHVESPGDPVVVRDRIRNSIMDIIDLLEGKGYVHGDLRSTNIMIKNDTYQIKVVDFDWAGEAGQTYYPIDRNDNIESWPQGSRKGYPIALGDDRVLVQNWWGDFIAKA